MSKDLRIVPLTKSMLREAIAQNLYWKERIAPMPKSKAIWVVSNTRIAEDDYCGVLGYEDDKMISFIFMLPDLIRVNERDSKKVYWILLWWVRHDYQQTVFGTYIFNEAVNLVDKQVIIKSYAENVNAFYEKQPFEVITSRLRHTIFFRLDTATIVSRFSFLRPLKFFINILSFLIDAPIRMLNLIKLRDRVSGLDYDYINQIDDETWAFIAPLCKNDLIIKTKEYINWQLNNNQYAKVAIPKKFINSALLAGNGSNIHLQTIKIMENDRIIGFLSYTVNSNEFNIKYFLVEEQEKYDICVDALIDHFIHEGTGYIFTDDTKLSTTISKRYTSIYTYKIYKKAIVHKGVMLNSLNVNVFNRDGHFY